MYLIQRHTLLGPQSMSIVPSLFGLHAHTSADIFIGIGALIPSPVSIRQYVGTQELRIIM